jgi:hypothetical protein
VSDADDGDEGPQASGRGNLVAVIAVLVLVALGYLAFHYIDEQRKLQNCLDSGRRDCGQTIGAGR